MQNLFHPAGPAGAGLANIADYGAVPGGAVDCTDAFNAALSSNAGTVLVPQGFWRITAPLTIPPNSGKAIVGLGGLKSVVLLVQMAAGYEGRGAIEYLRDPARRPNYAGCIIRNLRLAGTGSRCHGTVLEEVSYPLVENVVIDGFDGAGLLLDKCQDGSFNNLAVVGCGRTRGRHATLSDRTSNASTEFAPIHLVSTVKNDHCNMLRFTDCHVEQNRVSPYIWINDPGSISIWFGRLHAEVQDRGDIGKFDLLRTAGGDLDLFGISAAGFRDGFLLEGGGNTRFANCRDIVSVVASGPAHGRVEMSSVDCSKGVHLNRVTGSSQFVNCRLGDLHITDPGGGPTSLTNCVLGNVAVRGRGEGHAGVRVLNCQLESYTTGTDAVHQCLVDSTVQGYLNAAAASSRVERNEVGTVVAVNRLQSSYVPLRLD